MNHELLKQIVNRTFKVDIEGSGKDKKIFDARSVFAGICRDHKVGVTQTGKYIQKSHACIARQLKNADYKLNEDKDFIQLYRTCSNKFNVLDLTRGEEDVVAPEENTIEITSAMSNDYVIRLEKENKDLKQQLGYIRAELKELQIEMVKVKRKDSFKGVSRFDSIIEMLDKRVGHGEEDQARNIILRAFNSKGIKVYEVGSETFKAW